MTNLYNLGEIIYKASQKKAAKGKNIPFSDNSASYTDISFKNLSIENIEFVSSISLSTRGSWRLAQNKVMGYESFNFMKDEEYSKNCK